MRIVVKNFLLILFFIVFTNCSKKSDLNLKRDLSNFGQKMNLNDTVKINANLSMEWYARKDKLVFIKKNDSIISLDTSVGTDTSDIRTRKNPFSPNYRYKKLKTIDINVRNNDFEIFFSDRIERTKYKSKRHDIFTIIGPNDTLHFKTKNARSDVGKGAIAYEDLMSKFYPKEPEFKSIVIAE